MRERDDPREFRPVRESSVWTAVILVVVLLGAGALWWRWSQTQAPVEPVAVSTPPPTNVPADVPPPPQPEQLAPQNPVETPPDPALPQLSDSDARVTAALNELLGKKAVTGFLNVDNFVRRFVATVDNLPREHAASRMWPVQPAGSRFMTSGNEDNMSLSLDNAQRYTPMVLMAEQVNASAAAAAYFKLYPLFQQAYEELGYPGKYFNDRLVAVLDHLLAAPEPQGPVKIKMVEIRSEENPSAKPYVHYEFADPQLESMSAGQKMMVRVGLVNERRLKAQLKAFRAQVVAGGGAVSQKK